jgi:hypothetical protein
MSDAYDALARAFVTDERASAALEAVVNEVMDELDVAVPVRADGYVDSNEVARVLVETLPTAIGKAVALVLMETANG